MVKKSALFFSMTILLAALPVTSQAQDAKTVLANVAKAMGAENLKTLKLSASGTAYPLLEDAKGKVLPREWVKSYTRDFDFNAPASRTQMVRVRDGSTAEQTQNQVIPANAPWAMQYDIWMTPGGFLKGAMAANATAKPETIDGTKFTAVTFMAQNKYPVTGYINSANEVERVQTMVDGAVMEAIYHGYKDFGGVKYPDTIIQKQSGALVLTLIVNDMKPNVPVTIQ